MNANEDLHRFIYVLSNPRHNLIKNIPWEWRPTHINETATPKNNKMCLPMMLTIFRYICFFFSFVMLEDIWINLTGS